MIKENMKILYVDVSGVPCKRAGRVLCVKYRSRKNVRHTKLKSRDNSINDGKICSGMSYWLFFSWFHRLNYSSWPALNCAHSSNWFKSYGIHLPMILISLLDLTLNASYQKRTDGRWNWWHLDLSISPVRTVFPACRSWVPFGFACCSIAWGSNIHNSSILKQHTLHKGSLGCHGKLL